jgi:UrcA family protein
MKACFILGVLAAAAATVTPAAAFDPVSAAPRVNVSYGDLDLSTAQGQRVLEARFDRAVRNVCPLPPSPELRQFEERQTCLRAAREMAGAQLAQLRARGAVQLAQAPGAD